MLAELKADPFAEIEATTEVLYVVDSTKAHHRVRKADGALVKARDTKKVVAGAVTEEECLIFPSREQRWNGLLRYLPMPWAEALKPRLWNLRFAGAFCLSCHRYVGVGVGIHALACASDHDRTELNHQIVLVDAQGREVGRNAYRPLAVSC